MQIHEISVCVASGLHLHCSSIAAALHLHCICIAAGLQQYCICNPSAIHLQSICNPSAMYLHRHCRCNVSALNLQFICIASTMQRRYMKSECASGLHLGGGVYPKSYFRPLQVFFLGELTSDGITDTQSSYKDSFIPNPHPHCYFCFPP